MYESLCGHSEIKYSKSLFKGKRAFEKFENALSKIQKVYPLRKSKMVSIMYFKTKIKLDKLKIFNPKFIFV